MTPTPAATSLDLNEAAAFLGLPPNILQEWATSGVIPGVKLRNEWRFLDIDLVAYMQRQYAPCTETVAANPDPQVFATAAEALDDLLRLPPNGKNNAQLRRKRIAELAQNAQKKSQEIGDD